MTLKILASYGLVYLATPYSKYPAGLDRAHMDASRLAGQLLKAGVKVYSPIAHTHPIAVYCEIDPLDHAIWLPFDQAIMAKTDALCVAKMPSWESSYGIGEEIKWFQKERKPIHYLDPLTMGVLWVRPQRSCPNDGQRTVRLNRMRQ